MSIKTQGTELFFIDPNTNLVVKLACPTGVTGFGGPSDQIDTTCLDATTRSFEQGLKTPSPVNVPYNFDPAQTSHQDLNDLYEAGTSLDWMLCLSDGTAAPTADTDGEFVALSSRSNVVFSGYIADLTVDLATNEVVRGTMIIQPSGTKVWTYKA